MFVGTRCILRPYRRDDLSELPNIFGNWEVVRWMSRVIPHPYAEADAKAWIAKVVGKSPIDHFVIEVSGVYMGGIGIDLYGGEKTGVAELSYWLGPAYWGQGIASEAVRVFIPYVFHERRVRRLEASLFAPNIASARVLEKCGFKQEAVLREAHVDREENVMDCLLYARLASDGP